MASFPVAVFWCLLCILFKVVRLCGKKEVWNKVEGGWPHRWGGIGKGWSQNLAQSRPQQSLRSEQGYEGASSSSPAPSWRDLLWDKGKHSPHPMVSSSTA